MERQREKAARRLERKQAPKETDEAGPEQPDGAEPPSNPATAAGTD
jgi:hypothetical protein